MRLVPTGSHRFRELVPTGSTMVPGTGDSDWFPPVPHHPLKGVRTGNRSPAVPAARRSEVIGNQSGLLARERRELGVLCCTRPLRVASPKGSESTQPALCRRAAEGDRCRRRGPARSGDAPRPESACWRLLSRSPRWVTPRRAACRPTSHTVNFGWASRRSRAQPRGIVEPSRANSTLRSAPRNADTKKRSGFGGAS